jgi:hypothetical protein
MTEYLQEQSLGFCKTTWSHDDNEAQLNQMGLAILSAMAIQAFVQSNRFPE